MSDPTATFIEGDQRRWIFPLRAPVVFSRVGAKSLRDHIANKVLNKKEPDGFVTGQLAYSRKDQHHLRRVFVLDPLCTFYLYDFVHRNRNFFPRPPTSDRHVFGHCFVHGKQVDAFLDYHAFRRMKYSLIKDHGHFAQVDIFNCFNSFYHHDVSTFVIARTSTEEGAGFGQFLREINAGVSVACFPQGFYPAKVIGNGYLSLVDESRKLKIPGFARFLDDMVLTAKSHAEVEDQILQLQYVLDKHHLALNESKTIVGEKGQRFQEKKLDRIKRDLLQKREIAKSDYDSDSDDEQTQLTVGERKYLTDLLRKKNVAQEDIDLALALLRDEPDAVSLVVDPVFDKAPHLLRGLHRFLDLVDDEDGCLWSAVESRLKGGRSLPEHDLFWYARMLIDYFDFDQDVADLLMHIYQHPSASAVVKAAILETEYLEFGFADLKETALRSDGTLLVAAAGMVGLAKLEKGKRNHVFKYVARNGAHAALLVDIAGRIPG